ncbi:hypothetical protein [Thalassospira sp.]|uniref:hypothetical protein n=1 Tax=Thalassospira sp. TaxID=1912094 RepID=UPI002600781A|nr:hypothetical protein [Thalassospira sp.]|tara:strand:- start:312 stop:941 length:630 start_codon:yes stop_codon:yes gene_type:complete
MGKFVTSGDNKSLQKALGHYSRNSLGGRGTSVRRFNQMVVSGGALIGTLNELRNGGSGVDNAGVNLSRLAGQPVETAIQAIVEAIAPDAGDRELVRAAMQDALIECLPSGTNFDPTAITDALLIELIIEYLTQCVFTHIVYESGDAFSKNTNTVAAAQRENELMELIRIEVDSHATPLLAASSNLGSNQVQNIERSILADVLDIWETYE